MVWYPASYLSLNGLQVKNSLKTVRRIVLAHRGPSFGAHCMYIITPARLATPGRRKTEPCDGMEIYTVHTEIAPGRHIRRDRTIPAERCDRMDMYTVNTPAPPHGRDRTIPGERCDGIDTENVVTEWTRTHCDHTSTSSRKGPDHSGRTV